LREEILNKLYPLFETLGFHISRNSFYEPIPDSRTLKNKLWQNPSELIGIDLNEQRQLRLLSDFVIKFKNEYDQLPLNWNQNLKPYEYYINNGRFESVDGEILYCMIRHFKPKRIFEIGSGNSTYLSAQAILKNKEEEKNYECELAVIDPYPNNTLQNGFPGLSKLIPKKVQDISWQEFKNLKENDILFIDSSHVLTIGSDVQYEYLDILPRINKGVIVHSHDIFLPAEYPKYCVMKKHIFWTEQYLLQAFLAFNDSFEVLWAGNYMHSEHLDELKTSFNSCRLLESKEGPGSFWIRRIK
jgi:hypothetical protein